MYRMFGDGLGGAPPQVTAGAGRARYECPVCSKVLSTSHGLRRHINDRHTVHLTSYRCYVCHKEYRTPNSLQNHMYVYHKREGKS
ncbi:hypothetical protein Pmani_008391 [Petrolisthes manimaculis]|uniref:C2H2-type domain-containing protein n=1 Tax=Petrolisthes manimaculis TaxID=1843537 RepID=A0AAE1Q907_9EUCA|nr:hypothetical protein Pmani_008391 [Petrolisthes manimaculis]